MKSISFTLLVCLLVLAVHSQPNGSSKGKHRGIGRRSFKHRPPHKDVGDRVKAWKKGVNKEFPHELGADHYEEFDLMYPPNLVRNAERPHGSMTRWTNGIIPFVIIGKFSPSELQLMKDVMKQFNDNTCVKFIPRTNEPRYLSINNSETGCWSHVGMWEDNTYNLLNLQTPNCMNAGSTAHEMMHTVGFHHEFTRPDRDEWITFDMTALRPKYQNDEWMNTNFRQMSPEQVELFDIDYNYGSVMHYSRYAGAWNYTRPVILNLKPWSRKDYGSESGLAPIDILAINRAYNCPN